MIQSLSAAYPEQASAIRAALVNTLRREEDVVISYDRFGVHSRTEAFEAWILSP
jgi:hypothetical protein